MKIIRLIIITTLILSFLNSCKKENDIDKEKPTIDLSIKNAFPENCDTLYFGEVFNLKVLLSDNAELGSSSTFSVNIHNNFDHHSHSTEVTECKFDSDKTPINPFTFIKDFDIPSGLAEYETNLKVAIPLNDGANLYDEGDYHFYISLTDKEGWSTKKGLSIKMLYR